MPGTILTAGDTAVKQTGKETRLTKSSFSELFLIFQSRVGDRLEEKPSGEARQEAVWLNMLTPSEILGVLGQRSCGRTGGGCWGWGGEGHQGNLEALSRE